MLKSFSGMNPLDFLEPGVLKLVCNKTGRALFWECENVLEEISQFKSNLVNHKLDNVLLLEDYDNFGLESFSLFVVEMGAVLSNKEHRQAILTDAKNAWQGELY